MAAAKPSPAGLVRGVYALTRTKRRRVLWCAWWTGQPCADPFRAPDAWDGGALDEDEARLRAEAAAGMPLDRIEGRWAGAWVRVREGRAPFVKRTPKSIGSDAPKPQSPYALMGIADTATLAEVKAAFRKEATLRHPDKGGEAKDFIALKRAYDTIVERKSRPRRRS